MLNKQTNKLEGCLFLEVTSSCCFLFFWMTLGWSIVGPEESKGDCVNCSFVLCVCVLGASWWLTNWVCHATWYESCQRSRHNRQDDGQLDKLWLPKEEVTRWGGESATRHIGSTSHQLFGLLYTQYRRGTRQENGLVDFFFKFRQSFGESLLFHPLG